MKLTLTTIVLLFSLFVNAQTGGIKGRIYNNINNEGIPFANILVKGTNIGSTTDFDGNFVITGLEPGFLRLEVSSLGFDPVISEEIQIINAKTN